jgi:uncharacterized protein with NRDE domain
MCLIGLAIDSHPRYALVIAANRDEFHDRPTAGLHWWQTECDGAWLLAGRDQAAGGTWMGLSDSGRIGMLTNVRDPSRMHPQAPSRGSLVTQWLDRAALPSPAGHNPFNLIGGDLRANAWWSLSDSQPAPASLGRGVHALSNAALNTPWPKVTQLTAALRDATRHAHARAVSEALFTALASRSIAADAELPDTGIGLARERFLSPAFITTPDGRYGTRCSTVVLGERDEQGQWTLSITERSFDARGAATNERHVVLQRWPVAGRRAPVVVS